MTTANSPNAFMKRLEILRVGEAESRCSLNSTFLKDTVNYTVQMESFITNICPTLNTITGPYIEIFELPNPGGAQLVEKGNAVHSFQPQAPRSVLEVIYLLNEFVKSVEGLSLQFDAGFEITFFMTRAFSQTHFIKLNTQFAQLIGLEEYIFLFENAADNTQSQSVFPQNADNVALLFFTQAELDAINPVLYAGAGDQSIMRTVAVTIDTTTKNVKSAFPLTRLDTRLDLDVLSSIQVDSKVEVLNGKESIKRTLARFPINENLKRFDNISVNPHSPSISEVIDVGLSDLCRKNPNSQIMHLMNGEIYTINIYLEVRYAANKQIETKPIVFTPGDLFYAKLLFCKKEK